MLEQVTVTFNWDPDEKVVSDITCFVDGIEKKKKTTTRASKKSEVILEDEAILTLLDTKIQLNNKLVADMGLEYQDRLIIKYPKIAGSNKPFPVIGKDISWNEEGCGNKLTKTNTIAYRGNANTVLAEFGTEFGIEPYKEGLWKLISKNEGKKVIPTTYTEIEKEAENIDETILVDDNDITEIGDITFSL